MIETSKNSKRIAKNTMMLYIRMLLLMAVTLYTSRVVLKALGVNDFGIYNVVGGVVTMFSILSNSLSSAISRFITYELGKENFTKLKNIFSTAVTIQITLAVAITLIAEIVGLWFLNTKMNIPTERMEAANWTFQFSVITFVINLISVPYNAAIIAHEKMSAFAYISILEALLKLSIAFLIIISPIDKLIFYACLICIISLIIRLIYGHYCKSHFKECTYSFYWDKDLLKQMFGFAGWNFIGSSSALLRDQGGNILINLFFGPAVNAARGIAFQVNTATQNFIASFTMALNPQITKSYASNNYDYMMKLVFKGARFSFYLLLILTLPIFLNTNYILKLWLGIVPEHTIQFIRLILVFTLSESISQPLITAQHATGKIKNYQIIVGGLQMLNLPIAYLALKNGAIPETIFFVAIAISQICLIARLWMMKTSINLSILGFYSKVYLNILKVSLVAIILPIGLSIYKSDSITFFIMSSIVTIVYTFLCIFFIGCDKEEQMLALTKIHDIMIKIKS